MLYHFASRATPLKRRSVMRLMPFDHVTKIAAKMPPFRFGVALLVFGIGQFIVLFALNPGANAVGSGIVLWLCILPGWLMVSHSKARALKLWRQRDNSKDA
jgi:hypothetical protein